MYGPLGDPGSYGTARSRWEPKGFTGIEYPQAMPFSGSGGGGMRFSTGPQEYPVNMTSIWSGDNSPAGIQRDLNRVSDPMAMRQGTGLYNEKNIASINALSDPMAIRYGTGRYGR